jgi:hypothetical protein
MIYDIALHRVSNSENLLHKVVRVQLGIKELASKCKSEVKHCLMKIPYQL